MRRFFTLALLLLAPLVGCQSGDDGNSQTPPGWSGGAGPLDASAAPIGAQPTGTTPLAAMDSGMGMVSQISPIPDAGAPAHLDSSPGTISLAGNDSGPAPDAGPIIITIPTRAVSCGASDCTTTDNRTCCQGWSLTSGFDGTPSCATQAACTSDHSFDGDSNRIVMSDCDEPADCGGGQVCCFVRYGMPLTADLFSSDIVGPGTSRLCMNLADCNAGLGSFSGVPGLPIGMVACRTNTDCKDMGTCQPEQNDSATTGKGGAARPGVMVCR